MSAGKSIAARCLSPKIVHLACWGKLVASVQVVPAAKAAAAGGTRPRAMTLKQMSKVRGQSQIALSSALPSVLQQPSSSGSKVLPALSPSPFVVPACYFFYIIF